MRALWTIGIAGCILAAMAPAGAAQQAAPDSMRSTLAGVFTAEQAARGRDVYGSLCRSCHNTATLTPTFKTTWSGRSLAELYGYIATQMPKNDPGSLSPEDYTLVLAYTLKLLGMPAGTTPLRGDSLALARIRLDTLAVPR